MSNKMYLILLLLNMVSVMFCACSSRSMTVNENADAGRTTNDIPDQEGTKQIESSSPESTSPEKSVTLTYMGQASMRIVTAEGKVIYIDPYAGDDYEMSADLILVTHGHFDHSAVEKVKNRNDGCRTITHKEALQNGEHKVFKLGYVTVEAVEAGYNDRHNVNECVGYVLTFSNGKSVYVTGDTSTTKQMPSLAQKSIDYAFFCCDGVYNMGLEEAAECAKMVGAKHNIPYHNAADSTGDMFDRNLAEQFNAPNRLIVVPGEAISVE